MTQIIFSDLHAFWLQIDEKQNQLSAARKQLKAAKANHKASHDDKSKK